jgi:hypothetical protein
VFRFDGHCLVQIAIARSMLGIHPRGILEGDVVTAEMRVAVSRIIGLSRGCCDGLIAVFHLRPKTDENNWGRLHAVASVVVLVVGRAAFFLAVPAFHAATSPKLSLRPSVEPRRLVPITAVGLVGFVAALLSPR